MEGNGAEEKQRAETRPQKSKREREEPLTPLTSVILFQRTRGTAAAVRQMDTFADRFGEKFPRGKEKEGKVCDGS